jgi:hypothetical protein
VGFALALAGGVVLGVWISALIFRAVVVVVSMLGTLVCLDIYECSRHLAAFYLNTTSFWTTMATTAGFVSEMHRQW